MKTRRKTLFFAWASLALLVLGSQPVFADTASSTSGSMSRDDLANQIQVKAKQLDDINQQLEATRQSLQETKGQRVTLQKQLGNLQGNINQLDLSIKSDQISVQKLNLEVDSLNYDIQDIESSISDKRSAIEKTLVELQKDDHASKNLFIVFLRSKSLADGVMEAQNLTNLQGQLTSDIGNLRVLHDEYNGKLKQVGDKKESVASHQRNLQNKMAIVQDQKQERQNLLLQTKDKESVFQKQVVDLEKLQQQIASEVESLDAVLRTKIDPATLPPLQPGVLEWPIASANAKSAVTQGYGATSFAKNGYKGKWHNGVDFGVPIGSSILAAEDGKVVATGNQDAYCYKGAYGKFVVIQHGNNLTTLYGHLSRQVVQKGDTVKRGQLIGYSGQTGYATGPHLHFTVFASPTFYMGPSKVCGQMPFGGDLNPLGYL